MVRNRNLEGRTETQLEAQKPGHMLRCAGIKWQRRAAAKVQLGHKQELEGGPDRWHCAGQTLSVHPHNAAGGIYS